MLRLRRVWAPLCIAALYCLAEMACAQAVPDTATSATAEKSEKNHHLLKPITWGDKGQNRLQVGGETRIRFERRENFDLDNDDNQGDDSLGFVRTNVNFDYIHGELFRIFLDMVDAREIDADRELGQENTFAMHQLYVDIFQPGKGPWALRLGQQEMPLGRDKRLVEASSWSNVKDTFTGARAMYRSTDVDADLFVMHPNYNKRRRGNDTVTDYARMRREEWFYGGYATLRHFKPHTLEAYFFGLTDTKKKRTFDPNRTSEDGTYGSSNRYTAGGVLYGPLRKTNHGTLSYTGEGAFQFGRSSKDQIRSYFLRGDLTYEWNRKWKPSLGVLGTLASGDRDPDDGKSGTFSNLFGTNHSPYGIMDFVRPRNLRELALIGKLNPTDKLKLQAELHAYWMDSKTDTGISAPGESSMRDKTGRSGRELGQEVSLVAGYEFSERLSLEAGAAHFFPGTAPAAMGSNDGANFFYLQTVFRF